LKTCAVCGSEFEDDGYTVGLNLQQDDDIVGRLEEQFCSEKCGMEFALKIQKIAKEYFIAQREYGDAS